MQQGSSQISQFLFQHCGQKNPEIPICFDVTEKPKMNNTGMCMHAGSAGDNFGPISLSDPDVFAKLEYAWKSPTGMGGVRVVNYPSPPIPKLDQFPPWVEGPVKTLTTRKVTASGAIDFGTKRDGDIECMNYEHFVDAVDAYTTGTKNSLPFETLKVPYSCWLLRSYA